MTDEVQHFESLYPDTTREKEIAKVVGFLKEGNSVQLLSLPGVGRATVLGLLAYNSAVRQKHFGNEKVESIERVHFVHIDFSELRRRPLSDVVKLLFLALADSLRERGWTDAYKIVNTSFKDVLALQDELVLFQGLKKAVNYLANEKQLTIVYLFDRFEEYIPAVTSQFFANLRILRNHAKFRFSVVFSLPRPLDELIDPTVFADMYEYIAGHTVWMQLFDEVGGTFRIQHLEQVTGRLIDPKTKEHIFSVTGGHGKLTKLSAEAILANEPNILRASEASREDGSSRLRSNNKLEEFLLSMRTVRGALYEIWYSLRPEEQTVILGSKATPESDSGQVVDPQRRARMTKGQDDKKKIGYLEYVGLVKDGEIQIPLFEAFIQQEAAQLHTHQAFLFDAQTNSIKRGKQVFSDVLTASEFRLFQYLLTHQQEIVDRETLITVVWGEMKSTAGVSEQAVDQLVFRLRKKVEESPNQPRHIVTVKGRGIKFIA
ncbi:MAG TPA: helix-turn-helix domain-containing protein [Patescibacteria group bacterium]|nr:helix-turn-helix domain-containing protein [Patescibacteria group bacterium]